MAAFAGVADPREAKIAVLTYDRQRVGLINGNVDK
jgi:hypothetical protein